MAATMYNIFNSLTTAAKKTSVTKIFHSNRPAVKNDDMKNFVVISLPGRFYRDVKGNDDFIVSTSGLFSIGVKAKSNNTLDVGKTASLVQEFMDLFPINDDYITATKPQIIMRGDDESGFQVTSIMFDIRTKVNQYLK